MLSKEEQVEYYLHHKDEFYGESKYLSFIQKLSQITENTSNVSIAIDVGACIGDTLPLAKSFLKGSTNILMAFEPNPVNFQALERLKDTYTNLILVPKALSNTEEEEVPFFTLQEIPDNRYGYLLAGLRGGGDLICKTSMTTLDKELSYFQKLNFDIPLLKIDTEGNDTLVLEGCKEHLEKVRYIIFEASDCLDDKRGPGKINPLESCVRMLDELGFDVYRAGSKRFLKLNPPFWDTTYETVKYWSDCFACKKFDPYVQTLLNEQGFLTL